MKGKSDQAGCEECRRQASRERLQGDRRIACIGDVAVAGRVQRRCAGDQDEGADDARQRGA